ncbi:LOW QUALITY PROTEIN: uncharacterized protein Dere_GG10222 [Drosophila erecta]|uniref:DUF4729 domain-containing protein n=1 Tax=Drosophila erecta TaxID=7220 RepID=B3N388_DROER|nr:LOW QUALITY PROTEIN: uncharacterized protein Dere_GG10222 [Drosophila erecta]
MTAPSTSRAQQATDTAKAVSAPLHGLSRNRKRQERRKQRLHEMQNLLYTKHFSNYRLTASVAATPSEDQLLRLQLQDFDSLIEQPPSSRKSPLLVNASSDSPWTRLHLVACPCHGCLCSVEPSALLGHYLRDHLPGIGLPRLELEMGKRVSLTCSFSSLERDVNSMLGVYCYRRTGLNPLKCHRNTHLPLEYRRFSQHTALMIFACRTMHSVLWERKRVKREVLAIWVATPLHGVAIALRLLVQPAKSPRYYTKQIKARPMLPLSSNQTCSEFIKTDSNVILISLEDLRPLMNLDVWQQSLTVELKVISEARV